MSSTVPHGYFLADTESHYTSTWPSSGCLFGLHLFGGSYSLYNIEVNSLPLRRASEVSHAYRSHAFAGREFQPHIQQMQAKVLMLARAARPARGL